MLMFVLFLMLYIFRCLEHSIYLTQSINVRPMVLYAFFHLNDLRFNKADC